jgi:hypothetical protein
MLDRQPRRPRRVSDWDRPMIQSPPAIRLEKRFFTRRSSMPTLNRPGTSMPPLGHHAVRLLCFVTLLGGIALPVRGQASDVTPPSLVSLSFTPTSIDVTTGSRTVTVTARSDGRSLGRLVGQFRGQCASIRVFQPVLRAVAKCQPFPSEWNGARRSLDRDGDVPAIHRSGYVDRWSTPR